MLDLLDEVRHGLLIGVLPEHKLRRLLILSSVKREGFMDPRLGLILSDIELRAKVELAKLEMSRIVILGAGGWTIVLPVFGSPGGRNF